MVAITGTMTNTGVTFTPVAASGGTWTLLGGTITGGTIAGTVPLLGTSSGGTLDAVTVGAASTIDLSVLGNATCSTTGGLTLNGPS